MEEKDIKIENLQVQVSSLTKELSTERMEHDNLKIEYEQKNIFLEQTIKNLQSLNFCLEKEEEQRQVYDKMFLLQ